MTESPNRAKVVKLTGIPLPTATESKVGTPFRSCSVSPSTKPSSVGVPSSVAAFVPSYCLSLTLRLTMVRRFAVMPAVSVGCAASV